MIATPASLAQRRADLAKIHLAVKEIGMTDDEYRDLLFVMFGKRSSADLDYRGRWMLLDRLKKLGFKPRGQRGGQEHKDLAGAKKAIERKIGWQLGQLDKPWDYAYGVARRIYPDVAKFEFLTAEQLGKISSALTRTLKAKANRAP